KLPHSQFFGPLGHDLPLAVEHMRAALALAIHRPRAHLLHEAGDSSRAALARGVDLAAFAAAGAAGRRIQYRHSASFPHSVAWRLGNTAYVPVTLSAIESKHTRTETDKPLISCD